MPSSPRAVRVLLLLSLLVVFIAATYFRYTGLMWGEYEYQHPDERFLVWVVADIATVPNFGAYFDTAQSALNPANRGHAFFVYGDFPVIVTRYLAEAAFDLVGWQEILQVGRGLSALVDLLTVVLVWGMAARLYGWKIGLLAGLFSAAAVMQIQQAHFFTVDSFATFFNTLAVYLALRLVMEARNRAVLGWALGFGVAVGLAMACKVNTFVVAGLLPLGLVFRWLRGIQSQALRAEPQEEGGLPAQSVSLAARSAIPLLLIAVASGLVAFLVFRVAQPYAFRGPTFFHLIPDADWLQSIREQRAQATGDVDFPPALQWARRPIWFSFQNLTTWGLGLPLGILAWVGVLWYGWIVFQRIRGGNWRELLQPVWVGGLLLWLWTVGYFAWQTSAWNATMRYQLPIYPTLAIFAAWVIRGNKQERSSSEAVEAHRMERWLRPVAGILVLALTLGWAFAFTRMYNRTETRVAASRWILDSVPGPVNLMIDTADGPDTLRLPLANRLTLRPDLPADIPFRLNDAGALDALILGTVQVSSASSGGTIDVAVVRTAQPDAVVRQGAVILPLGSVDALEIPLSGGDVLEPGLYTIRLTLNAGDGESGALVSISGQSSLRIYERVEHITGNSAGEDLYGFTPVHDGSLRQVRIGSGIPPKLVPSNSVLLLTDLQTGDQRNSLARLIGPERFALDTPLPVRGGSTYTAVMVTETGSANLLSSTPEFFLYDTIRTVWLPEVASNARVDEPLWLPFVPQASGALTEITLGYAAQVDPTAGEATVTALVIDPNNPGKVIGEARAQVLPPDGDPRGRSVSLRFAEPIALEVGRTYSLTLMPESGELAVRGAAPANETSWDMALPFRMRNYDPYGGIYRGDLNFEMYWDDNEEKRTRFYNILDQADYIFISSNRQWATTTRLPERHPLTTEYYRALMGCPPEQDIIYCYNVAEVGSYTGRLGYSLVQVFTSYPNLGPLEINTQFAEEAFTVYDHPKVFIFQRQENYDPAAVREILGAVDLRNVIHITPRRAADFKDMLLTAGLWARQQQGGTWATLFPPNSPLNQSQLLAVLGLYVFVWLLSWILFPLVRVALPNLPDQGYGVARIAALLLLAYPAWLMGSLGISVTRPLLLAVCGMLVVVGAAAALLDRSRLRDALRANRAHIMRVELVCAALFAVALLIRLGNPDLWHPIYGGEKPMDFSHFNAVLKSTVFPPYDPWFAGGALNYYYFGYVLVGMPVKLLGITPSVAYNLILPLIFSIAGTAAFSMGWNLLAAHKPDTTILWRSGSRLLAAGAALSFFLLLGNLGTVRMLWQGFQQVAQPGTTVQTDFFTQLRLAAQGAGMLVSGQADSMPFYNSDWYWKPSRAIQPEAGNEITEFPLFTFLYGDMHAHWMTLPLTLLALAWCLNMAQNRSAARSIHCGSLPGWTVSFVLGALVVGALRPANTWDQYTYLALACVATVYGLSGQGSGRWRWILGLACAGVLAVLALGLYQPFNVWFGQAYNQINPYPGPRTNLASYVWHWGVFLFVIITWMVSELSEWMRTTPVSRVSALRSYREVIILAGVFLCAGLALLIWRGVEIVWIAGPVGVLAAALLLRPGLPDTKRAVLFLIGTAMALTIAVELVAVQGDISRMNTVFKFYYQAWTLLSISAGAALGWIWMSSSRWQFSAHEVWVLALVLLVSGTALYPIAATRARMLDRMTPSAPRSLDGMDYMAYSRYGDGLTTETYREMELIEDYRAIRWVQENIQGTPVVVEANTPEYRHWGTRFTIYTGLPGVIGWNWHERQQRALTPDTWVYNRIDDVQHFYQTTDREQAQDFLRDYDVGLIVVGQLEQIYYDGPGLEKFAALDGDLWDKIYQDGNTALYLVRR